MDITFHTYGVETGSSYLMCSDMAKVLEGKGHSVKITTSPSKIEHSDLVVVNHPKDIMAVKKLKRFVRMGRIVILFSPHPNGYMREEMAYMLAAGYDTEIVCHSAYLYDLIRKEVKALFAPAMARTILSNIRYIPFGILPGFEDHDLNDRATFVTPFNRCDEGFKRYSKHKELTEQVKVLAKTKLGLDTRHLFRHAEPALSRIDDFDTSCYELWPQAKSRDEYQSQIRRYGMFFSVSKMESFGLYYLELLASGVVGVFADTEWVRRLLPDYPFVCPIDQVPMMVLSVLNDYEKAREYVKTTVQPMIREKYSLSSFVDELIGAAA